MTARHYARRATRLKAYYTVPELAELAGCSRVTMWRKLKAKGAIVPGERRIPLSALRLALADLWESLELARELARDSYA